VNLSRQGIHIHTTPFEQEDAMVPIENRTVRTGFQAVSLSRYQRLSQQLRRKAIQLREFGDTERPILMERPKWDRIAHRRILNPNPKPIVFHASLGGIG
jgi:hypothetical protein